MFISLSKTITREQGVFCLFALHTFFISNTFVSNTYLKLTKNQVKAKQHPNAELWLFENYYLSSTTLSSKYNTTYFKECVKKTIVSTLMRLYY